MRKFVIGDIHGCCQALKDLIEKIDPQEEDILIFLGDYIDRGKDSKEVIDYLLHLRGCCKLVFLMGNHESWMLDALGSEGVFSLWMVNGGRSTILSYLGGKVKSDFSESDMPQEHVKFFKSLKLYYEDDKYICVHGGVNPGIPMEMQRKEALLWNRPEPGDEAGMKGKKVIVGHTPQLNPVKCKDMIFIDTGVCFSGYGYLTAVQLPEEEFIQVKRIEE